VTWRMAEGRPTRVGQIAVTVTPPHAMPSERLPAFLAVAKGCTVHHSLAQPPAVDISISACQRSPVLGDKPVESFASEAGRRSRKSCRYRPSSSLENAVGKVRGVKVTPSLSNPLRSSFSESHRLL
jgi:hypothetical protein